MNVLYHVQRLNNLFLGNHRKKMLIICISLFGLLLLSGCAPKQEIPYTSECVKNDHVYVDVISVEPTSGTVKNQRDTSYEGLFCDCVTESCSTVIVYIDSHDYNNSFDSGWNRKSLPEKWEFNPPIRIHGYVTNRESISKLLVGESNIIKFSSGEFPHQEPVLK